MKKREESPPPKVPSSESISLIHLTVFENSKSHWIEGEQIFYKQMTQKPSTIWLSVKEEERELNLLLQNIDGLKVDP